MKDVLDYTQPQPGAYTVTELIRELHLKDRDGVMETKRQNSPPFFNSIRDVMGFTSCIIVEFPNKIWFKFSTSTPLPCQEDFSIWKKFGGPHDDRFEVFMCTQPTYT